jgi:hypothetical protein
MYLASFDTDSDRFLQGCMLFPHLSPALGASADLWWREYTRLLLCSKAVEGGTVSLRILSGAPHVLQRLLIVSAPAAEEAALRRYLGSLTCLENVVERSVALPLRREEYDDLIGGFPTYHCRVATPTYCSGEVWFACDFRVAPLLDELLSEATTAGYRLGYQAHVRSLTVEPTALRNARRNALRLRGLEGAPVAVVTMQERLVDGLADASAICEEFLAADTPEVCEWLSETLQRHFRRRFGPLKFDTPKFEFTVDGYGDVLGAALHTSTFVEPSLDEVCASAVNDKAVAALLGWRPSAELSKRYEDRISSQARPETLNAPSLRAEGLPSPYEGVGPFIFVSYTHSDAERVAPILLWLAREGCNLWYDRGIPGGAEWDALLEEKIACCACVLLFVSPSSISSKYVRREAKFADTLSKPIVSVILEETNLSQGMRMLLTQYQILNSSAVDFDYQLLKAIRHNSGVDSRAES